MVVISAHLMIGSKQKDLRKHLNGGNTRDVIPSRNCHRSTLLLFRKNCDPGGSLCSLLLAVEPPYFEPPMLAMPIGPPSNMVASTACLLS